MSNFASPLERAKAMKIISSEPAPTLYAWSISQHMVLVPSPYLPTPPTATTWPMEPPMAPLQQRSHGDGDTASADMRCELRQLLGCAATYG